MPQTRHEPGDPGGYLAQRAVYCPDPAGRPGDAAGGAGRSRRGGRGQRLAALLLIRLPLLRSAILVALVIRTVEAFRVFDIIYVITNGGPAFGTVTISFLTYLETFSYGHIGRGAALSFLISFFTLAMALHLYPLPVPAGGHALMKPLRRNPHPALPADDPGAALHLSAGGLAGHLQHLHPGRAADHAHPLDPAEPDLEELHRHPDSRHGGLRSRAHLQDHPAQLAARGHCGDDRLADRSVRWRPMRSGAHARPLPSAGC